MDTNTLIEGTVKFRDGKKWKSRWCVVRKLSPVADCLHLQLYRDSKERYKQGQTKASLSLENFLGIQSGFTLDKESNTLAVVCQEVVVVLAFDTREHLIQWQVKISTNLGEGEQVLVQVASAPPKIKLPPGPARLLLREFHFCLTVGVSPRLVAFWRFSQLRRFGVVDGKFCFEGGSQCGPSEGLYVLVTEKPEELARAFQLAAEGRLSSKKRNVARNMSVIDKCRTFQRPDSRLSDVSSVEYTPDSEMSCECSHSREDMLSWPHSPSVAGSSDSSRCGLKPSWSAGREFGRCRSCSGKLSSMTRSSTMSHTPSTMFPAWTMERPKSCGSQQMSASATCSSMSLSSHSSKGSCSGCYHPADSCSVPLTTSLNTSRTPSRPPKPSNLNVCRLQTPELPSPMASTMSSPSCCHRKGHTTPYGNYDVPKSFKDNLKLDLKVGEDSTRLQSQSSSEEYYDTPRRLKDCLVWEYGNYDIPPPAQPIMSSQYSGVKESALLRDRDTGYFTSSELESNLLSHASTKDSPVFPINKVKLTGEGRMPVMSPQGIIVEPSYEDKLDHLLENECLDPISKSSSCNYENVENCGNKCYDAGKTKNMYTTCDSAHQNYSNFSVVDSLDNYENVKFVFTGQCKNLFKDDQQNINAITISAESSTTKEEEIIKNTSCVNYGHACSAITRSSVSTKTCLLNKNVMTVKSNIDALPSTKIKHSTSNPHLNTKCDSTSSLKEISHSPTSHEHSIISTLNQENRTVLRCSVSASNSPAPLRHTRASTTRHTPLQHICLRHRSNSADSARFCPVESDAQENNSKAKSSCTSGSICSLKNHEELINISAEIENENEPVIKLAPLAITEFSDEQEQLSPQVCAKYLSCSAKRSSSVPNKFFSNRDSSSSNDSGVSIGSLSLRNCGADFLNFEMPLTTSLSSKMHNLTMNNTACATNCGVKYMLQKRSKSVDPLKSLTFTFGSEEQHCGKSTSAEAEIPIFLGDDRIKDHVCTPEKGIMNDTQSTSSGASDMSDYFETLSFSSINSLDADSFRCNRSYATTMKPRSGKEYQQIDRNLIEQ